MELKHPTSQKPVLEVKVLCAKTPPTLAAPPHGEPLLLIWAEPGRPPGAHQQTPPPDLAPAWTPSDLFPGKRKGSGLI